MRLSSIIVFAAFVPWTSTSPIDDHRSKTFWRRGNSMSLSNGELNPTGFQEGTTQLSEHNEYISWDHSDSDGKHRIYVTAFDGAPVRTYIVDSDEEKYTVTIHPGGLPSPQPNSDTIMHQNCHGSSQNTYVLRPIGLRTYSVYLTGHLHKTDDPNTHFITYYHKDSHGKKFTRVIGRGGQPESTVIEDPGEQRRSINPIDRSTHNTVSGHNRIHTRNSVWRRGHPMVKLMYEYISWHNGPDGKHRIFVTRWDGKPVRTILVNDDEQYKVVEYPRPRGELRQLIGGTIMHQNREGMQNTYVLRHNGMRTYVVDPHAGFGQSDNPNVHVMTYYYQVHQTKSTREIGHGGHPVKTVIESSSGQTRSVNPVEMHT